jgi:hypothetical protein
MAVITNGLFMVVVNTVTGSSYVAETSDPELLLRKVVRDLPMGHVAGFTFICLN